MLRCVGIGLIVLWSGPAAFFVHIIIQQTASNTALVTADSAATGKDVVKAEAHNSSSWSLSNNQTLELSYDRGPPILHKYYSSLSNQTTAPLESVAYNTASPTQKNQSNNVTAVPDAKETANKIVRDSIRRGVFTPLGSVVAKLPHDIISTNTSNMEYPHVCFYGSTNFYFHKNATRGFVIGLLTLLRDVALRSYNNALMGKGKVTVIIPIRSFVNQSFQETTHHDLLPHFTSFQEIRDFMQPMVSRYDKLNIEFIPDTLGKAATQFLQTNCSWVVSTKLDADDFLVPGYLDWIAQKVIPSLENDDMRGALVSGRFIGKLEYGYGRCDVNTNEGPTHWPGESMGQTRVLRREVFEALGMPFEAPSHVKALTTTRRGVLEKILLIKEQHQLPEALTNMRIKRSYSLTSQHDSAMENITGIRMIETHQAGFGAPGVWLRTPLSSHLKYDRLKAASTCSVARWSEVIHEAMFMNGIKSQFDYVYDTLKVLNASLYDACKSSRTFPKFNQDLMNGSTCEEMDRNWRSILSP